MIYKTIKEHKMRKKNMTQYIIVLLAALTGCTAAESMMMDAAEIIQAATDENGADTTTMEGAETGGVSTKASLTYPVVDTGQESCFDDANTIACPTQGETYFGQDAQYSGLQPAYQDNGDGTVSDLNTGLMWIQDAGDKVTYDEGAATAVNFSFAGYDDWRVPTIKELYSLIDFSGIDVMESEGDPFIDDSVFVFAYGDTSQGDRVIDSQWITSTIYQSDVMNGQECFFGVNFADGRIKCYPTGGLNLKGYYLRLVRGEPYGENMVVDNENGTISDIATGMMWQQADSGEGMDWPSALGYCEALELGGYDDWRLPNAKELQSIVDYGRSPDGTGSAAINGLFEATAIVNELGLTDYAYYWSSTTHNSVTGGGNAVYISFGRGMGSMKGKYMDVHGAGSQRSDPKTGDPADFPYTMGPQGDVRRLENYVRCVRGGASETIFIGEINDGSKNESTGAIPASGEKRGSGFGGRPQPDLASVADILGVSIETLRDALGDPAQGPPDLKVAAAKLGISEEVLMEAMGIPRGGPTSGGG